MSEDFRLALEKVVLSEAAEIVAAREKCRILHETKDIKAAGDEVEICVRDLLRRRLGHNYYVGHGHIVDSDGKVSPQLDVIIADASVVPAVFRSENGTEYFPYECVYAVGEVKATYRKSSNAIGQFMETRNRILSLKREDVPPNFIRTHGVGFSLGEGLVSTDRHGSQNILFTFMLFADSGDFDNDHGVSIFSSHAPEALPNVTCLLDKGLIVYTQLEIPRHLGDEYKVATILSHPSRPDVKEGRTFAWTLFSNGSGESRALSWGVLYGMIIKHLLGTTVKPVDPIGYLQRLAKTPIYALLSDPDSRDTGPQASTFVIDTK